MADIGDLHALAHELLDAMAESLDTIPVYNPALLGAPTRAFVTFGTPVWDCCEQLAVHVPLMAAAETSPGGLPAGKRHLTGRINHVFLTGTITRCVPTDVEPPVPVLEAAAEQINADGWALWNHLFNLQSSGLLLNLCDEVFFDGITAASPSGGCAGWTVSVRAYLGGYNESFGT